MWARFDRVCYSKLSRALKEDGMGRSLSNDPNLSSKRTVQKIEPKPYLTKLESYRNGLWDGTRITVLIIIITVLCVGFFLFPDVRETILELLSRWKAQ